jgi:uncharacterized protein
MTHDGSTVAVTPTTAQERILALDALRGVAVLGILLMNIIGFGLPHAYTDPSNAGGASGADLGAWIVTSLFFEGTMRGLFTLLFGAGGVLYTSRLERAGIGVRSADLYFRRTMWLILFGLVNAYLLVWHGDILYAYGIAGLLLYVFRHLPPRRLLAFAIPLLCVQTVMGTLDYVDFHSLRSEAEQAMAQRATGVELGKEQRQAIEAFEERLAFEKPTADEQAEHVAAMRASYASALAANAGDAFFLQTDFFLMLGLWECLGMMLLGMALLKSGALTAQWTVAAYLRMLVLGWAIGLTVNALEVAHQLRNGFEVQSVMTAWYVTYDLGRIPLTLGHLAFVMLLLKGGALRRAFQVLANVGQMALTNYLAQSVICLFVFTGAGFALFGQLDRHQLYFVVLAIWVLQLAWSPWWLARYRYGPMEWLWRSLTRWQRQPLRRQSVPDVRPNLETGLQ